MHESSKEKISTHVAVELGEKIGEGNASEIWTLKENPDKVVRFFNPLESDTEEIVKRCKKGARLMQELEEKYNIAIPPISTAIGESPRGIKSVYTLTDR
ncbi:MAG: hypothetical protein HYW88_00170, partial [Candidatus Sungbacteria bacterium]|nr:hypothetical protein [Candidatus Sungbacteria bacterium]